MGMGLQNTLVMCNQHVQDGPSDQRERIKKKDKILVMIDCFILFYSKREPRKY